MPALAREKQAPVPRFSSSRARTAGPPAGAASSGSKPPEAPPTLVGPSGALPTSLADGGRWFARTLGDGAILLTFLPSWDAWRAEVAKRWSARWEKRSTEAAEVEEGGVYSGRRRPIGGGGDEGENDASLGLFLFLVRVGNFGLPIEPQTAMLRDVRNVLLAHIPASYHREMAFKPAQRLSVVIVLEGRGGVRGGVVCVCVYVFTLTCAPLLPLFCVAKLLYF